MTFDVNGGNTSIPQVQKEYGTFITLPTPTRTGYRFDAWYDKDGTKIGYAGTSYKVTSNITLYAHWSELSANEMLDNFEKSNYLSDNIDMKNTLISIGHVMIELGWKPAYIAGVLGYIQGEGRFGLLEGIWNNYETNQPYLKRAMDIYPNYKDDYANQYVYANKDISILIKMVETLEAKRRSTGTSIGFGIGCCQWSFERALTLVYIYREIVGTNSNYISYEQTLQAESLMIIRESRTNYKTIYSNWLNRNIDNYISEKAANDAGYHFLLEYGLSTTEASASVNQKKNAEIRGNNAKAIYNAMLS